MNATRVREGEGRDAIVMGEEGKPHGYISDLFEFFFKIYKRMRGLSRRIRTVSGFTSLL